MANLKNIYKQTIYQYKNNHDSYNDSLYAVDKIEHINDNLLMNSNFQINQRGQTTYTASGNSIKYGVDRWCIVRGVMSVNSSGGIDLTCRTASTTSNINLRQYFIDYTEVDLNQFRNKIMTISFSGYKNGQTSSTAPNARLVYRIKSSSTWNSVGRCYFNAGTTSSISTATFTFPDVEIDRLYFEISYSYEDTSMTLHLDWIKLEYGAIATAYVPPDSSTELLRCQRYYTVINRTTSYQNQVLPCYSTYVNDTRYRYFNIQLQSNIEMRTTPSLDTTNYSITNLDTAEANLFIYHKATSTTGTSSGLNKSNFQSVSIKTNPLRIEVYYRQNFSTACIYLPAIVIFTGTFALDAEIYG